MRWRYRYTVLVLCMLAFFVTYFARLAISPVVPFVADDFRISNTQIGLALTGMWLAYGLAQFPSGVLADRYGEKPIVLVAVGGTTAASLLLAFAPLYPVFVGCAVALGAVAGLHYSVATTLLSRTFDDLGTAVGLHSVGGPLAGLVAPVAAAWVGVRYGWRPAVALSVGVGLPVFALFAGRIRPTEPRRPTQPMRDRFEFRALFRLVSRPSIAFPLLVVTSGTYIVQGLLSFLPTFLVEYRPYSPTAAGVAFSAFFVVGPGLLAIAAAVLLAGVGSSFFSAIDPRFLAALSEEERGAGFGLVRTVYTVVGAAGSVGVGLFADR